MRSKHETISALIDLLPWAETKTLVACIRATAGPSAQWAVDVDDGDPEELDPTRPDTLWVVSHRALLLDGETVSEWSRCSCGGYDDRGYWSVDEDTEGGAVLPDGMDALLTALGLPEDPIPSIQEPGQELPQDSANGPYAVWWETTLDDAHLVARYAARDDAEKAATIAQRALARQHPGGQLLCHYGVRVLLDDGRWVPETEEV